MWEYLAVLLIGFWLGVAIFLYISCYWLEEILDLPPSRNGPSSASSSYPSASSAHAQLKRLVARVVEEAAALPALARYAAEPPRAPSIESSTYEDLLATAILNKVIIKYQTENGSGGRSSGIHSASASPSPSERSSPRSLNSRQRDVTPPRELDVSDWEEGEGTDDALEMPRRVPFPEFGGDIVHKTDNGDRDFDEVSGSDIQAVDGSWEENWLFQKKKIKTIQSVPVPMLVPNSNTEYRALIGDRDADDTTDLSDNASDGEEDAQYKSDVKRVLDSKHVIGGKSKIDEILDYEPDSLTLEAESGDFEKFNESEYPGNDVVDAVNNSLQNTDFTVAKKLNGADKENSNDSIMVISIDSGPLSKAEFNLKEEIHRAVLNGNVQDFNDMKYVKPVDEEITNKDTLDSFSSNKGSTIQSRHEREGEYEETVTIPVQRYADSLRRKHFDTQEIPTRDTDKEEDLIPGSIAYRERKKWLNYVEMPNNPYSPEAIQKRLMSKSSSSLFDTLTTKSKDIDDLDSNDSKEVIDTEKIEDKEEIPIKDVKASNPVLVVNTNINMNGTRSKSPSPKMLQEVLEEDIPQYKRYDKDYYIKEAKSSSGARKKNSFSDTSSISSTNKSTSLDNFDTELSPGLLIKQFNTIAANQQYTTFAKEQPNESITTNSNNNKTEILIEYDDCNDNTLFSAKPVLVDDDTDKRFEEILQTAYNTISPLVDVQIEKTVDEPLKSPSNVSVDNSYISTSSLEDSIKIYNVQTGEIVKCQPEDKISPRYEVVADGSDCIDIDDKETGETIDRLSLSSDVGDDTLTEEENLQRDLERICEVEEILAKLPKVKELAKKFVSMDNLHEPVKPQQQIIKRRKSKDNILNSDKPSSKIYMHSLTARSISKEFREELKLSMATPLTVPGGSKEIPEGEEVTKESSRPGSPVPEPGSIKTKLAFFESLKNKFSNSK
ncbi:myosin-7a binding protein [Aphomia sociella]